MNRPFIPDCNRVCWLISRAASGCRACENACRVRQKRPPLPTERFGYGAGRGQAVVHQLDLCRFPPGSRPAGCQDTFPVKKQCLHCLDAACVSPARSRRCARPRAGAVVYEAARCIGCRYCMVACPFQVPRYEWNEGLTPRVGKCDFCDDRVAGGLRPACVTACPTGTLKFGQRGAILREALARMWANPNRYVSIYGDKVVGGTAWILPVRRADEQLGFRTNLPEVALPSADLESAGQTAGGGGDAGVGVERSLPTAQTDRRRCLARFTW